MIDSNESFKSHLSQIEFAKQRATEIFSAFGFSTETAMASLSRTWELLFDSICSSNDGSISELKDISSVIQRLSSSHQKIQEIELKNLEKWKSAELNEEKLKLQSAYDNLKNGKLPNEVIKIVEEQLQLL